MSKIPFTTDVRSSQRLITSDYASCLNTAEKLKNTITKRTNYKSTYCP
jgi:hypothetical protein